MLLVVQGHGAAGVERSECTVQNRYKEYPQAGKQASAQRHAEHGHHLRGRGPAIFALAGPRCLL